MSVAVPIWAVRWWRKFSKIETEDVEFQKARKTVKWAGIIVSLVLVLSAIVSFVVAIAVGNIS